MQTAGPPNIVFRQTFGKRVPVIAARRVLTATMVQMASKEVWLTSKHRKSSASSKSARGGAWGGAVKMVAMGVRARRGREARMLSGM